MLNRNLCGALNLTDIKKVIKSELNEINPTKKGVDVKRIDKHLYNLGFKKKEDLYETINYFIQKGIYVINVRIIKSSKTLSVTVGKYPFEIPIVDNLDFNDEDFALRVIKSTHIIQNIKKHPDFFSPKRLS